MNCLDDTAMSAMSDVWCLIDALSDYKRCRSLYPLPSANHSHLINLHTSMFRCPRPISTSSLFAARLHERLTFKEFSKAVTFAPPQRDVKSGDMLGFWYFHYSFDAVENVSLEHISNDDDRKKFAFTIVMIEFVKSVFQLILEKVLRIVRFILKDNVVTY
jgi:hypothetical protein